jgi:transposase-like protein
VGINKKEDEKVLYICLGCGCEEYIPKSVVEYFDEMDRGDKKVPPRFTCEKCGKQMEPEHYESIHGIVYKIKK